MSESGKEFSNLYMRGVNEAINDKERDAQELLDLLTVFKEEGLRWYLVGVLEGIADLEIWPWGASTENSKMCGCSL